MPYGQEMQQFNPELMQAMQAQERMRFQNQAAQGLRDQSGAAGGVGILASALGGLMQGRNANKMIEGQANIDQQLAEHQAQVKQQLAAQAQAKMMEERGYKEKLARDKFEREQGGRMDVAKYRTDNAKSNAPIINVGPQGQEIKSGPVDKGYYQTTDPQTGEPILKKMRGGAPEEKQQDAQNKMRANIDNQLADFSELNPVIDKVINQIGPWTTGFRGSQTRKIAGGEAFDLSKNLETIQSDQALNKLIKLKAAGGTLGAVSEKELALLMNAKRSLDQSQSEEQFRENLMQYKAIREQAMVRIGEAYNQQYGEYPKGFGPQQDQPQGDQLSDNDLVNKYL